MSFLGISIPGLRIAGGLVIAIIGFRMLFSAPATGKEGRKRGPPPKRDISFTPLAMPSLAGPGSIAVVIGMSTTAQASNFVILRHALIAVGIESRRCFAITCCEAPLGSRSTSGQAASSAMTGIMGFLLVCIGVQFVINGVAQLSAGSRPLTAECVGALPRFRRLPEQQARLIGATLGSQPRRGREIAAGELRCQQVQADRDGQQRGRRP